MKTTRWCSLYIDGKEWTVIGHTLAGPQTLMTGGEMARFSSTTAGKSWKPKQLTGGSKLNMTYARRPVPHHEDFVAFWADGDPSKTGESSLYLCDAKGTVYRMPREMTKDGVKPKVWK